MLQKTLKNRTIFCSDNIEILENINSEAIDLIYLDPPFNKKKVFTAPIGSQAEGAEFSDFFRAEDVKDEWLQTIKEDNFELHNFLNGIKASKGSSTRNYNYCYLCYMAIRLIECHRILKDTGSIYLHCDPTMSHGLRMVLDCIFGEENFRNEIVWHYRRWTATSKKFQQLHDTVLFYSKTNDYKFNQLFTPYTEGSLIRKEQGVLHRFKKGEEPFLVSKTNKKGVAENDVWHIPFIAPSSKERIGYPTQKPLALLERIIKASSKEGDMVLDPFCGCATTCIAAEKLGRKWIGIDVGEKAIEIVKLRLNKEISSEIWDNKEVHYFKTSSLKRTDGGGKHKEKKYVYIVLKRSELPFYKVGIAKDWKTRLNSYQTADKDRDYEMIYKLPTTKFREIEKFVHFAFESLHEWVNAKKEKIIEMIELLDKFPKENIDIASWGEGGKHLTKKQREKVEEVLGAEKMKVIDNALKNSSSANIDKEK